MSREEYRSSNRSYRVVPPQFQKIKKRSESIIKFSDEQQQSVVRGLSHERQYDQTLSTILAEQSCEVLGGGAKDKVYSKKRRD